MHEIYFDRSIWANFMAATLAKGSEIKSVPQQMVPNGQVKAVNFSLSYNAYFRK